MKLLKLKKTTPLGLILIKPSLILPLNFKTKKYYNKLNRYKPKFLCMEDNEHSNDDDRARGKAFLQLLFPYKSEFEN